WMWYPFVPPENGEEEALRAERWIPVEEPRNQRIRCLAGQMRPIRRLLQPGEDGNIVDWARAEDIAAVDAVPVTLVFSHSEDSLMIPSEIEYVLVAQRYPPTQMGRYAVVGVECTLAHYSLDLLVARGS